MSHEKHSEPIDLMGLVSRGMKALRRLWAVAVLLVLVGGGVNFLRAWRAYTPMYQSTAILSVTSGASTGDIFSSTAYYDTVAAQQMAESFPYLISADMTRDLILQKIGPTFYKGSISCEVLAETNLLQLTARSREPQAACDIVGAVIECYPQVAVYMVDNPQLIIRQAPSVPLEPYNPFSGRGAALKGALAGLVLAAALVALRALLVQPITGARELKRVVNLPLLATFPRVRRKGRGAARGFITAQDDPGLAEALRGLRTKVRKQLEQKQGRIVLLTSTIPGEGKSTTCANLALSMAAEGRRVVLVDGDLRKQSISQMFGSRGPGFGLLDCINEPSLDVLDCLQSVEGSGLVYLSGSSIRKRHYSIDARGLRRVLDRLAENFDCVVVDTPPCTVVSDTAQLCRYADAVVYVIRQDYASQPQILDGLTGLYERDVPLTGCVLNGVPRSQTASGYGYGYGYGSRYGRKGRREKE